MVISLFPYSKVMSVKWRALGRNFASLGQAGSGFLVRRLPITKMCHHAPDPHLELRPRINGNVFYRLISDRYKKHSNAWCGDSLSGVDHPLTVRQHNLNRSVRFWSSTRACMKNKSGRLRAFLCRPSHSISSQKPLVINSSTTIANRMSACEGPAERARRPEPAGEVRWKAAGVVRPAPEPWPLTHVPQPLKEPAE